MSKLIREAKSVLKKIEANRALYKRLDSLTLKLRRAKNLERYGLTVVDNFAKGNTAYRVASVKRFELKSLTKKVDD